MPRPLRSWTACLGALCLISLSRTGLATEPGERFDAVPMLPESQPAQVNESPPEPHHLRTLLGMGAGLGALAVSYWSIHSLRDFDKHTFGQRLDGTAWRTDNNHILINYAGHPFAGAGMYVLARANHHGVGTSAGYMFLSSFLWEFAIEYREFVSTNDMIATPITGLPLGEFFHKLGQYLDAAPNPGFGTQVAQWTLGFPARLDRSIDGAAPRPHQLWHDFDWRFELGTSRNVLPNSTVSPPAEDRKQLTQAAVSFRGRLISLPSFLTAPSTARFFHEADIVRLEMGTEASRTGQGLFIHSDAIVLGMHLQSTGMNPGSWAHSTAIGLSLGYRFIDSDVNGYRDQLGVAHLPGLAIDMDTLSGAWLGNPTRVEFRARVQPDYAGAGSLAYPDFRAAHPGEIGKHILKNHDYFYGWGYSGSMDARLRWGPLQLSGEVFYGRYRSQEGNNRWQERLTIDPVARTRYLQYRAGAQWQIPQTSVALGVSTSVRDWDTSVEEFRRRARARTYRGSLSWAY